MSRQAEILVMWWISLVAQKALGQSARVISRFQAPVDAAPVVLSQLEYLPCQHCSNDTLSVSCSKRSGASTEGHYAASIGMAVTPVATSSTLLLRATHDWWEVEEDTTSPIRSLYGTGGETDVGVHPEAYKRKYTDM
ncbi:unnamed protein product [Vitrella brassicaformis CCMP3155]|uniref:Uncharacterized protein n=1 Tax=Vitrella brassicaformis (strain CCMP3155) TaxID=1169540 RepID=A0A0G4EAU0_VITBC|nr:unnamed protein product [Vitrella brassicaformis CCMP3155]|eukprot:CEL92418.1 unnamed protein product [Vitrella brassicaformis CCMP3155]